MPYISQFLNRVINADCLAALPQLQDGSVDFVLTDPPYLVGYHDRHGRSIANDVDGQWLKPAFAEVFRVLKSGRFCVSFYGWHKADEFLAAWRSAGFRPVGHLVWVKSYASKRGLLASQQVHRLPGRDTRIVGDLLRIHRRARAANVGLGSQGQQIGPLPKRGCHQRINSGHHSAHKLITILQAVGLIKGLPTL